MKRPDFDKLLGGYAPGNLTDAERRELFEAALEDQQVFDALAGEEPLRELLEDPAARHRIAEAAAARKPRFGWWVLAPAGAAAATAALALFMLRTTAPKAAPEPPRVEMAKSIPAPPPAAATRESVPPPAAAKRKQAPQIAPPPALAPQSVAAAAAPPKPATVEVNAGAVAVEPTMGVESHAVAKNLQNLGGRAGGAIVSAELQDAVVVPTLRYTLEQKAPGGEFAAADPAAPLDSRAALRLKITPLSAGYLYVRGAAGLLFSAKAEAAKEYTVDLPPREPSISLVLSREPERESATKPLSTFAVRRTAAAPEPGKPVVIELKLTYR